MAYGIEVLVGESGTVDVDFETEEDTGRVPDFCFRRVQRPILFLA